MQPAPPNDPSHRPLFTARTTHAVRIALLGVGIAGSAVAYTTYEYFHSPYWNRIGIAPDQPVLFSHRHHAGELRIDCRFCHTTVETSANAGLPSTQTCLTCHSQLFRDEPMLRPVMISAEQNKPLVWTRVATLPDHVHFNHSIHIAKGIACVSCHGDVTTMALTAKAHELTMRECLDCHRNPELHQVQAAKVFSSRPVSLSSDAGTMVTTEAAAFPVIHHAPLTNCSTCHH